MSYLPTLNTNIAKIYDCIPDKTINLTELIELVALKHPAIPSKSIHIHAKFLSVKKLVEKSTKNGTFCYRKINKNSPKALPKTNRSDCVLLYCKSKIGKKITGAILLKHCFGGKQTSTPFNALKKLSDSGYVQFIDGSKPKAYLILPEIKTIDRIPYKVKPITSVMVKHKEVIEKTNVEVMKTSITEMSIGEILDDYMSLKQENQRMKDSLQRMANELFQLIEK